MEWLRRQFDTRTVVLMPIAIAINIVLGQTVAAVLKIPIYLDSIGTILVGALAGPIPGAVTGLLTNLLWQFALPAPFHSDIAGPFAIVAAEIGLLAGLAGRMGVFRGRPGRSGLRLVVGGAVAVAIVATLAYYTVTRFYGAEGVTFLLPDATTTAQPIFLALAIVVGLLLLATVVGFFALLLVRRDLGVAYVTVAGVVVGIVSAIISAPISARLFGGVTGSGTDLLVASFRQAGADLQAAVLGQGLISDPIDKLVTFLVVFFILQALSRRFVARFPQGEQAIGLREA